MTETPLNATLAAEHAALYVYAALGARTSESTQPALFAVISAAYDEHRRRRDDLEQRVRAAGGAPAAAAPAYALPPMADAAAVTRSALRVEQACASAYAAQVAATVAADRRWAIEALAAAATTRMRLGGRPVAFPGLAELAGS